MIPKFRGLSIDEKSKGEWQYGYLIEDNGQTFIINEVIEANEQYITIGSWCPVDPKTVGQSTGLHDKNGKEIFEGDILCDEGFEQEDEFVYVSVSSKEGMWICTQITNEYCGYGGALNEFVNDYSVIGNIYENPELLEVE